jgi:hypothetical protein
MNASRWLRALTSGRGPTGARASSLDTATAALLVDAHAVQASLVELANELAATRRQIAQLAAMMADDADAPRRLDALVRILDADAAGAHVRHALQQMTVSAAPLVARCSGVVPEGLYRALVDAVPAAVFFRPAGRGDEELPVPPKLAPAHAMATWLFVADLLRDAMVPAIVERLGGELAPLAARRWPDRAPAVPGLAVSGCRIVRMQAGERWSPGTRASDLLCAALPLATGQAGSPAENELVVVPAEPGSEGGNTGAFWPAWPASGHLLELTIGVDRRAFAADRAAPHKFDISR